jgi:hypothetical protein
MLKICVDLVSPRCFQGFRVLSENERTAALYSLLQQSTTAQVRFFQKVLSQMSQSDPVSALLSPAMGSSMQSQQDGSRLGATPNLGGMRSPGLGSGGFPSSPSVNQFLAPDAAVSQETFGSPSAQLAAQRNRMKQNRISAPMLLSGAVVRGWTVMRAEARPWEQACWVLGAIRGRRAPTLPD